MTSEVFLPAQDEVPAVLAIRRSNRAQPQVLTAEAGVSVLVPFSSPGRTRPFSGAREESPETW